MKLSLVDGMLVNLGGSDAGRGLIFLTVFFRPICDALRAKLSEKRLFIHDKWGVGFLYGIVLNW